MMEEKHFQPEIHELYYEDSFLSNRIEYNTLVMDVGRPIEKLDGLWRFSTDWYDNTLRSSWYNQKPLNEKGQIVPLDFDFSHCPLIAVPSCWNLTNTQMFFYEGTGIYVREFSYAATLEKELLYIRFEGSNYRTSLFINGYHVGTHLGGSTPFCALLSPFLQEQNTLLIAVDASRRKERIPMLNFDWFNYGGLYRSVSLIRVPILFIRDWFVRLIPNGNLDTFRIQAFIEGEIPEGGLSISLKIKAYNICETRSIHSNEVDFTFQANLPLWSIDSPTLHEVIISLHDTKKQEIFLIDEVSDTIGFREIKTIGKDLYLNGKKIRLKGVCVHEDHHLLGKTTTEQIIRDTIQDIKDMHGNYVRLAHYPHSPLFAKIADEQGILLWEELPVYWAIDFANPQTLSDAKNQLSELIVRDRNRASVIVWSVGNENADTEERLSFMRTLIQQAKELDDSRLISAACLINASKLIIEDSLTDYLDIIGINEYYGWYDPDFNKLQKVLNQSAVEKPLCICEFGGGARATHHGTTTDLFSEEKQAEIYRKQLLIFEKNQICGISPWILYDFRSPKRLNAFQNGINRKGLIDFDRKTKKLSFHVLRDFYATWH